MEMAGTITAASDEANKVLCIIIRGDKILFFRTRVRLCSDDTCGMPGCREKSHGKIQTMSYWEVPHTQKLSGETVSDCAARLLYQKTGIVSFSVNLLLPRPDRFLKQRVRFKRDHVYVSVTDDEQGFCSSQPRGRQFDTGNGRKQRLREEGGEQWIGCELLNAYPIRKETLAMIRLALESPNRQILQE